MIPNIVSNNAAQSIPTPPRRDLKVVPERVGDETANVIPVANPDGSVSRQPVSERCQAIPERFVSR